RVQIWVVGKSSIIPVSRVELIGTIGESAHSSEPASDRELWPSHNLSTVSSEHGSVCCLRKASGTETFVLPGSRFLRHHLQRCLRRNTAIQVLVAPISYKLVRPPQVRRIKRSPHFCSARIILEYLRAPSNNRLNP